MGAGLPCASEKCSALGVDGGRGDDHLQVTTSRQQLLEIAQQEVNVQAAFMGLIDDEGVIAPQGAVVVDLGQQHAIGHHLHGRIAPHLLGEAHLIAHGVAQGNVHLLGQPLRDRTCGDPPRLRVPDVATTDPEADLRELGGLARARLPRHDHHLVIADQPGDLVDVGTDGQGGIVGQLWLNGSAGGLGHNPTSLATRPTVKRPESDGDSRYLIPISRLLSLGTA